MYIRVSNERVIGGQMRTPGEVIEIDDANGEQAIRDGFARRVNGGIPTPPPVKAPRVAQAKAPSNSEPQPDPQVATSPSKKLAEMDPHPEPNPDNVKK